MRWSLRSIQHYENHRTQWDELNRRHTASPLLHSDFIVPLLEQFSDGTELLAIQGDSTQPNAMAIISKAKLGVWRTFQPSQAPVGPWLQNPDEPIEPLLQSLQKSLPGIVLKLSITQQDPFLLPRPGNSKNLTSLDYIDTARVTVSGEFDNYWSERGKNLRQNLRRKRNSLDREKIVTHLKIISDVDSVTEAVTSYGIMESAGWKSSTNTSIEIENSQGRFYKRMLEDYCRKKQGLIFQYYYNDSMVATDLCILGADSLVILKTTFDEQFAKSSPAMLMRQDAFKHIFDSTQVRRIEFYGKVMDWHTRWSNEIRTMYHVNYISAIAEPLLRLTKTH